MTRAGGKINENSLALCIFVFAILYRLLLLQTEMYPPGPDAGLHSSIINSMVLENGNFSWNYYHMGGGPSLTHPGFHFFTSFIWLTTGMPDYLAQYLVAALFSSLIVLSAFLITRAAWGLPFASLIAAFLAALSRYDIEMIAWGGYPNVVTLMIISLAFYVFFRRDTSSTTFVAISSLLIGTLFITHSLSVITFLCIASPFLILAFLTSKKSKDKRAILMFVLSIFLGVLLASPFIAHVLPVYLENVEEGMFVGTINDNREAIVFTRMVSVQLVLASLIPAFSFLMFSKKYKGVFFSKTSLLFSLWIFIPAVLTQSFIIGVYTDYFRFLHFLIFPLTVFFALLIDHTSGFITKALGNFTQHIKAPISLRTLHSLLVTGFLVVSLFGFIPFFSSPAEGFSIASYYRVVYPPEFESIEWIKGKTSSDAIFVSSHGYGWWISGLGQRVTLSATEPQFLIIPHEFEAAYIARTLLRTNFVLNNGFIEIWDDGSYVGRYNPMLLINCSKFPEPYPMFYFNESEMTIFYRENTGTKIVDAIGVPPKILTLETAQESARMLIVRENAHLTLTRRLEVLKGTMFAILSLSIKSLDNDTSLEYVRIMLHTQGKILQMEQTVGVLDENAKVCAQIIFEEKKPFVKMFPSENPNCLELLYAAENAQSMEIKVIIGGVETEKMEKTYIESLLVNMTRSWSKKESTSLPIQIFDYREIIKSKKITFIACERKKCAIERFVNDPMFNLVFINDNVAIFKVRESNG